MKAEEALAKIGDWRLDKAIQHLDKLRAFAQTEEDHAWIDRYQGWFLQVKGLLEEVIE